MHNTSATAQSNAEQDCASGFFMESPAPPERPAKLPLFREPPPPCPFPLESLPPLLRDAVEAIVDQTQCQPAIAAGSVLAVASLAVQAHADVVLPHGQRVPASLYILTIAESGDRKSAADGCAMAAVRETEAAALRAGRKDWSEYELKRTVWSKLTSRVLQDKRNLANPAAMEEALRELGEEPRQPLDPSIVVVEPTMPGLEKTFQSSRPSLGLFSDEGGQMIGGHAMREEARLHTLATLNNFWQALGVKRTRAGDGNSLLLDRRLAVHLMVQPGIAPLILGDTAAVSTGLTARLLVAAPPSLPGSRLFRMPADDAADRLASFKARIGDLLADWPHHEDDRQRLKTKALTLTEAARARWISFHDECQARIGPDGSWSAIRAWGEKGPEHAARIAAVLAVLQGEDCATINAQAMDQAIGLAEFYGSEMVRLSGQSMVDPDVSKAAELLSWLRKSGKISFHLAEVYQYGPNCLRTAAAAEAACRILESHGELVLTPDGLIANGKKHRKAWLVVPD